MLSMLNIKHYFAIQQMLKYFEYNVLVSLTPFMPFILCLFFFSLPFLFVLFPSLRLTCICTWLIIATLLTVTIFASLILCSVMENTFLSSYRIFLFCIFLFFFQSFGYSLPLGDIQILSRALLISRRFVPWQSLASVCDLVLSYECHICSPSLVADEIFSSIHIRICIEDPTAILSVIYEYNVIQQTTRNARYEFSHFS